MGIGLSSGSSGKSEAPPPSAAQCFSSLVINSFCGHVGLLVTDIAARDGVKKLQRAALAEIMPVLGDSWVLEGLATEETLEWYFLLVASHFVVFVLFDATGTLIKSVFDLPPMLAI